MLSEKILKNLEDFQTYVVSDSRESDAGKNFGNGIQAIIENQPSFAGPLIEIAIQTDPNLGRHLVSLFKILLDD